MVLNSKVELTCELAEGNHSVVPRGALNEDVFGAPYFCMYQHFLVHRTHLYRGEDEKTAITRTTYKLTRTHLMRYLFNACSVKAGDCPQPDALNPNNESSGFRSALAIRCFSARRFVENTPRSLPALSSSGVAVRRLIYTHTGYREFGSREIVQGPRRRISLDVA